MPATNLLSKRSAPAAFAGGAVIGALGGLIGLGGAEFRLPLLIGAFRFPALQAVILNKAMSLVVVTSALPFRAARYRSRRSPRTGPQLSTCWREVSSARGSARDGPQSWPRELCIASSRSCCC